MINRITIPTHPKRSTAFVAFSAARRTRKTKTIARPTAPRIANCSMVRPSMRPPHNRAPWGTRRGVDFLALDSPAGLTPPSSTRQQLETTTGEQESDSGRHNEHKRYLTTKGRRVNVRGTALASAEHHLIGARTPHAAWVPPRSASANGFTRNGGRRWQRDGAVLHQRRARVVPLARSAGNKRRDQCARQDYRERGLYAQRGRP